MMNAIGRERGWVPITQVDFDALCAPRGALLVGSLAQVIEKVLYERELFHHDRFLMQISVGTLPHRRVMHAIELLGTEVAPAIRRSQGS